MLNTIYQKKHVLRIRKTLRASAVERIIQTITDLGFPITNRTHVVPEIATYENRKIPLQLISTENVLLESFNSTGGILPNDYFEVNDDTKLEEYRSLMAAGTSLDFSFWLRHISTGHIVCLHFGLEQTDCYVSIHDMAHIPSEETLLRLEWLEYLINCCDLPVDLTFQDVTYEPIHLQGGKIEVSRHQFMADDGKRTYDLLPSRIKVTLADVTSKSFFNRIQRLLQHPDFRREGCHSPLTLLRMRFKPSYDDVTDDWALTLKGTPVEVQNQLHEFEKIGLPSNRVDLYFFWYLRDYRFFREMTPLAKTANYGTAGQSLMDFEFAPGKQARLDLLANRWGSFQVVMSFDERADADEVSTLLGIKLEESRH